MIWRKRIFSETVTSLLLFLTSVYLIYVLIDFSTHSARLFSYSQISLQKIFFYYSCHFLYRFPLFLPLAFMLSLIKVLGSMNSKNELISLQMAGLSIFKLIKPILCIAFLCSLCSYINYEYFYPTALYSIENFKDIHLRKKPKLKKTDLQILLLKDGSKLIYLQKNDKDRLFDAYLLSQSTVWHMEHLIKKEDHYLGQNVDFFERTDGKISKKLSFNEKSFYLDPAPSLDENIIENQSIRKLCQLLNRKNYASNRHRVKILSQLHHKLAMLIFPFILLFGISPYCLRFSRNLQLFPIITYSLFGFILFFMLLDALAILGENQAISAPLVIGTFTINLFLFFFIRFLKINGSFSF